MYLSLEGLSALIGTILVMIGFPILLFGDHFDPATASTSLGTAAKVITGIGLILIAVPFVVVLGRLIGQLF